MPQGRIGRLADSLPAARYEPNVSAQTTSTLIRASSRVSEIDTVLTTVPTSERSREVSDRCLIQYTRASETWHKCHDSTEKPAAIFTKDNNERRKDAIKGGAI